MGKRWSVTVTIPNGAAGLSAANDFSGGAKDIAVIMPATWVAADLTYQVAGELTSTFTDLYTEAGAEVMTNVDQAKTQSLDSSAPLLSEYRWVKVRSGPTAAPVNQTAARTLTFLFER